MTLASTSVEPALPQPQGPLSAAVLETLTGDPARSAVTHVPVTDCNPFGIDLQVALYVCYELSLEAVDPRR
jgi:hypothetical protein